MQITRPMAQPFGRRSETRHQLLEFGRDVGFYNVQKRPIVQEKFAAKALSAGSELNLISPKSLRVERQAHAGIIAAVRDILDCGAWPFSGCSGTRDWV
jgi:hypothetical protein